MRVGEHDENYLWLRQSVTFTADGQTRTLEIAIPVRRGSTPEEIETMLDEADAGMARLSRRLDAHLAELLLPPAPTRQTTSAEAPPQARTPAPMPAPVPAPMPSPSPAATQPAALSPMSTPAPAPTPAPRPERPAASTPARPAPARPPAASAPAIPATPPSTPMTIPQFIAGASELGLNPKQAMDRLSVRTLSGLNLREALETLRRQMLRDEPADSQAAVSLPASPVAPPPATPPPPAPSAPTSAQFFEEEDDYTFGLEDDALEADGPLAEAPSGAGGGPNAYGSDAYDPGTYGSSAYDEPSALGEDDFDLLAGLPDFDALAQPPVEPEPAPPARASSRASAARAANGAGPATPMPAGASGPLAGPEHGRALRRIGQLRGAQGGGAATSYQRNTYKNLVVDQLSETTATGLVRGLWRTTPTQLTGDQLDALSRWAKEDAFTEEVPLVLEALRAERARAAREGGTTSDATSDATGENRPPQTRRASGSRGEPAGGR